MKENEEDIKPDGMISNPRGENEDADNDKLSEKQEE